MGEFRITGPGRYRQANGVTVELARRDGKGLYYPWVRKGRSGDNAEDVWLDNGSYDNSSYPGRDIVEGPLDEPQAEMAGLSGFAVWTHGGATLLTANHAAVEVIPSMYRDGKIIDLSKVPIGAIVKPEPKRETRKVWLVFWESGDVTVRNTRPAISNISKYTAIVEREIEFVHGEGMGDAS